MSILFPARRLRNAPKLACPRKQRGFIINPYSLGGGGGGGSWSTADSWTPIANDNGWNGYSFRVRIDATLIPAGSKLKITMDFGSNAFNVAKCYTQTRNMAGDPWEFSATPVQVLFGGSGSVSSGSGGVYVSDEIILSQDGTKDIVMSVYFGGATNFRTIVGSRIGWNGYYQSGDSADTTGSIFYSEQGSSRPSIFTVVEVFSP